MALLVVVLATGLLLLVGIVWQGISERRDASRFEAPGDYLYNVHVHRTGSGQPPIILEAGIAASSVGWALVQPELALFGTVFAHDRPGLGYSPRVSEPHTAEQFLEELREVVRYAGAPVILVGHSFGGLLAQLYAARYREDLLGIVLVDPALTSEWAAPAAGRLRTLDRGISLSRRGAWLARIGFVRFALVCLTGGARRLSKVFAKATSGGGGSSVLDKLVGEVRKLPPEVWPVVQSHWCRASAVHAMADHLAALPAVAAEVEESRPLPADLPVTVISGAHLTEAQRTEHAAIAAGSTRGRHLVAEGSGHWVHLDRPDVIVAAVREMADQLRGA